MPILLEECGVPQSLSALQWIDLWKEDGWTRLRKGLDQAIERRRNLAAPIEKASRFKVALNTFAGATESAARWLKRRALTIGLMFMFVGVLLLIGGLSGEALSRLISVVGLQRAKDWNGILRAIEITTLAVGATLVSVAAFRSMNKSRGLFACVLLWIICALLMRISIPAPNAFALAYDRYLVDRSDDWRRRLIGFRDPATGGIRDGADNKRVQAWTTAQAIVAILASVGYDNSKVPQAELRNTFDYLEKVRLNAPEDGWGYFGERKEAITDVTSWVALAEIASLRANLWNPDQRAVMTKRITRELAAIAARQTASGGWSPVIETPDDNSRTYSTVMALWALAAGFAEGIRDDAHVTSVRKGVDWLLNEHHPQLGWVPNPRRRYQTEDFPGLTAQALIVLAIVEREVPASRGDARLREAQRRFAETQLSAASIRTSNRVPDSDQHLANSATMLEGSTVPVVPVDAGRVGRSRPGPRPLVRRSRARRAPARRFDAARRGAQ